MRIATASVRTGFAMTGFFHELRCKSGRRGEGTPPYNHTLCRAGPVYPAGGAVENRFGSSGRPTPTLHSTIELRRGRRPRRPVRISYQVLRRARKNPPVTASPCQPSLGKGAVGTGDADCHSQCAHWLRNDGSRKNLRVIPRPVRRLVVGIRNTPVQIQRGTDCHTSDIGHWFAMTGVFQGVRWSCFPFPSCISPGFAAYWGCSILH